MSEPVKAATAVYDLFVSYSPSDREWVEGYLLDALSAANMRVLSERNFALGAPRTVEFERAITQSKRTLLVLSPAYMAEAALQFVDIMVSHYGLESGTWPVIPLVLHPVELPPRLAILVKLDMTDPDTWDASMARLFAEMEAGPPTSPVRPPCPYPGMRAFSEQEAANFYGREAEVEELIQHLRRNSFIAVIGPSGSGKSSLVRAGLIPALRRSALFGSGEWLVRAVRPGAQPLAELARGLGASDAEQFDPAALFNSTPGATRLLLLIDQFEEVFSLAGPAEAERQRFFAAIRRFVALPACYAVIAVRADFFSDLLTSALWPLVQAHRLEIAPLDEAGLRAAIVKPAENVGVFVETALVERLVAGSASQPGVLPFVQEVMVRLWEKLERRFLPLRAYEALILAYRKYSGNEKSGIQAAMAQLGDEIIERLSPEQQRLAQRIFLRLVQFGEGRADTRRQQPIAALAAAGDDPALFEQTLTYLADNRLITLGREEGGEPRADLAHEAMLTGWPKLQEWIQDCKAAELTRRRLEDDAAEWLRLGRGSAGLLVGKQLQESEAWLRKTDAWVAGPSPALLALIAESRRQAQRRKTGLAVRYGVLGLLALVVLSIIGNVVVEWSLNRQWQSVEGAPANSRGTALVGNQQGLVLGSRDYGVTWTQADGKWVSWQRTNLPIGNPAAKQDDPQANVKGIDTIALDPFRPDVRYVFVYDEGIFRFQDDKATWTDISAKPVLGPVPRAGLPRRSDACESDMACAVLAVWNDAVAFVANVPGFYLSTDGGESWTAQVPAVLAAPATVHAVAFDSQGRLLVGDDQGLVRGSGAPPYIWDRVYREGKVVDMVAGPDGTLLLFVASGNSQETVCLDDNGRTIGARRPLPAASRMLESIGGVAVKVLSAVADPRAGGRFYFTTTHGAVYETDCAGAESRIGQASWLAEEAGKLGVSGDPPVLYWATLGRFVRRPLD